jgi:hypothetical protein
MESPPFAVPVPDGGGVYAAHHGPWALALASRIALTQPARSYTAWSAAARAASMPRSSSTLWNPCRA